MKEEKCCCGCLKITTAVKIILWSTVVIGLLHAVTPSILNVSAATKVFIKIGMVAAVVFSLLALLGIKKDAPKLVKPVMIFNVVVQILLLAQIFYSIAAIFFPNLPLPDAVKDVMQEYQVRFDTVQDKVENVLSSIAAAILVINVVLYAISLRVLLLLVKCFYTIKNKRYQPVPAVFRMPSRPLVVVKTGEGQSSPKTESAIEMSKIESE